ncbi:SDR family NAD(P)-dependent oxidoreductase [Actinomadura soli]|uniref:SDR family NAD(P)-dependent oxidoreductase n=1 Tax=Actinomadura soli TaxID=2508997 RepID=UPI00197AB9FC|nr:SDR family NAD(P)-dependent oxidoreductase [Actinomadura soli]
MGAVSTADGAAGLVRLALDSFGALHAVVNNAGILRDRTIVNMTEDEWDSVIAVHLRGTFLVARKTARHWRERSKAGAPVDARIINTSSVSGLFGNTGQSNHGAAKDGIAGFTIIASLEPARYGITVNAVSPSARTRMITPRGQERMAARDDFDPFAPREHRAADGLARRHRLQGRHRARLQRPRRPHQRRAPPGSARRPDGPV